MVCVALLLGGECTGKSSLATALALELDARIVPEVLRSFVDQHGRPPQAHEQKMIYRQQVDVLERSRRDQSPPNLIVSDPAPLMTAVYSIQYFKDDSLLSPALEHALTCDVVLWCEPDLPWSQDGIQRDGPVARDETHHLLEVHVIPRLQALPVVRVRGNIPRRSAAVRNFLATNFTKNDQCEMS